MMNSNPPRRPSPWAMGLLLFSSGFALLSLTLISTGYGAS